MLNNQENELLEGYRELKPESRQLIMSMVASVIASESVNNLQQVQEQYVSNKKQDSKFSYKGVFNNE